MELREGYKQTEIGEIPEDWTISTLGNIAKVYRGASPRPIENPVWFDDRSDIGWVRIADVSKSKKYLKKTTQKLSAIGVKQSRFIPSDSLIMSICATVGRPAITNIDVCIHDGFVVFDNPTAYKEYLYYVLKSLELQWSRHGQTGSQMNLNTGIINPTKILLPPKPEQKAIAKALSDVDALIESLEQLIAKKRHIKQGAIQELLTGKRRLPGFEEEWKEYTINELFDVTAGGDLVVENFSDVQSTTHPYPIYANSIFNKGLYGFSSKKTYDENRITVTARGTLGVSFYRDSPFVAIGRLIVLNPIVKVNCFFISEIINNVISFANESTSVPQLTAPHIAKRRIKIPGLEEQQAIATILSDMDSEIEALEAKLEKTKQIKEGMMHELLTGRIRLV